jgi:broad specificity phosphatase PhoE
MTVKLWLVRHGRTAWNAEGRIQGQADLPLDEFGWQQAQHVADRLKNAAVAAIYSSPLQRARQTAEMIGAALDLPITFDDRLKEYDFGVLSGLTWTDVVAQHPKLSQRWADDIWSVPIEGSEGRTSFHSRIAAAMQAIVAAHDQQQVVVVAHGGAFAAYLTALLNLDVNRRHPFHFANASLSVIEIDERLIGIDVLNDTCHLNGGHEFER